MFYTNENILGVPQMTVQLTLADWRKFLGQDGSSNQTSFLPYPGAMVRATDPVWGECWFQLAYGLASLQIGEAVTFGAAYAVTRPVAATKGVIGISMSANTDPTALSWYCVQGQVPVRLLAAAANLPLYTSATAGSLTTTVVATQGVTGAFALTALAATIGTKSVGTVNGSPILAVPNLDGLYVGAGVTGTGIPGGTTISALGVGGQMLGSQGPMAGTVQLSANCTATGQVTGTFAHGAAFATGTLQFPIAVGAV
jgi:hypothetical protein